jgi:uncharacterized protein (DUF427 family)
MRGALAPLQPGQESVWDYLRPSRLEEAHRHIQIVSNGVVIADTRRAWRALDYSHPPLCCLPATPFSSPLSFERLQ